MFSVNLPKSSSTQIIDQFPRPIREIEYETIPLADGTKLAVRYWLPEDADENPVPAILEYIPYCTRDGTAARDEAMHPYFAGHGYAALRVDMRGSGESEGVILGEYLQQEQGDALEVIAWIAAQPWCSGNVGMMGKSWGGFNGLQVAARQPPALKCIITVYSTVDRYADDIHYMGGCLLAENPMWAFTMFGSNARPPDPALVGERWREMWQQRLTHNRPWLTDWLIHQRRDDYWKHGSICEDYNAIQIPVYAIGGWADAYTNVVPQLLDNLSVPCKGLVGPWGHQYPHQAFPGPAIGFLQEALRWWDHWLKDTDNGIMDEPRYRVWLQTSASAQANYDTRPGRWIAEPQWPSSNIQEQRFTLNTTGLAPDAEVEQALTLSSPQDVGISRLMWAHNGAGGPESPTDQRIDDARSLCFDSPLLGQKLEILGAPAVELELAADQPNALVCVRLCEVLADNSSVQVSFGVLNLTHRNHHEAIELLQPGQRYRVNVSLNHIAHEFAAGSRLRVAISTSYWPIIWPAPAPVQLSIYSGISQLSLPVRAPRDEDAALRDLPPPQQSRVHDQTLLRAPVPAVMRLEHDIEKNQVAFVTVGDSGKIRFDQNGWEYGAKTRMRQSIQPDDPLSARIEMENTQEYGRANGPQVRLETHTLMTADAQNFYIKARLDAFEHEQPIFSRSWLEQIPRDGV